MAKKRRNRPRPQQARSQSTKTASGTQSSRPGTTAATPASRAPNRARKPAPAPPPKRSTAIRRGLGRPLTIGIVAVVVIGGFYGYQWLQSRKGPAPLRFEPASVDVSQDPSLAGLQSDPPPWDSALGTLRARLEQLRLPYLDQEVVEQHFHLHLDVFVDGKAVAVPDDVGRNEGAGKITVIHTHPDEAGLIHIEAPAGPEYNLGQLFDVWGVRFTPTCLGPDCKEGDRQVRVYADGQLLKDDPRRLILALHQEIVVTFGTPDQLPHPVPSKYSFPIGA